jgi:hypothetical protein
MAPEQVTGGKLSAATDVFAVGVVLYEFLTNRRTFDGETLHAVLYQVVSEQPPPLRDAAVALPPSLQPILDKALAKDPSQRYQSAGAMVRDLTAVRTSLSAGATVAVEARATPLYTVRLTRPPASPRQRRVRLIWIGAGAGAVAFGIGAVLLFGPRHPRPPQSGGSAVPAAERARPAAPTVAPVADPASSGLAVPPREAAPSTDAAARPTRRADTGASPERRDAATATLASAPSPSRDDAKGTAVERPRTEPAAPVTQPAPASGPLPAPIARPPSSAPQPAAAATEAPQAPASVPPADPSADARPQLEALVAAYAAAIEARSLLELRRLYPGMTGPQQQAWEQFFHRVRTVRVQLSVARLAVDGATADLTVAGSYAFEADGPTQHLAMRFQATAALMDEGWRFRTVR